MILDKDAKPKVQTQITPRTLAVWISRIAYGKISPSPAEIKQIEEEIRRIEAFESLHTGASISLVKSSLKKKSPFKPLSPAHEVILRGHMTS